ncbi:MAG: carbonic anhydrase family protein [Rubrivivax sp.]|nr:carbonic anhydrase family protein [Rubrivivax sp.]
MIVCHAPRHPLRRRAARPVCRLWTAVLLALLAWPTAALASEATPRKATAAPEARTGSAAPARAASASATASRPEASATGDLDRLRERLAEKLGARPVPAGQGGADLVRVSAALDATAAVPASTPRVPAAPRLAGAAAPVRKSTPPGHWSYAGDAGPATWGSIETGFATCSKGQRQSPIDIRGGIAVELEPVQFDYRGGDFSVLDNGHTVQASVAPGNTMAVGGRRFELQQLHFHRPAEERIDGRGFDMSLHLVHKDHEGRLAVVALLLERGETPQPVVQRVWNDLPLEKHIEQRGSQPLDPAALLPVDRGYFTYMGSLTTPPCSEDVLWIVMRQPIVVTRAQIDVFTHLYPMNARPLQAAAGRLIKQSQ